MNKMEKYDDIVTVNRVLAGDMDAFSMLIDRHKDMVYTIALRITRSREDAEEVSQDAFLKAYQRLSSFRKESKFATWLYRIVYNESISRVRKKQPAILSLDEEITLNPADEALEEDLFGLEADEQQQVIDQLMATLPEADRVLLTLFYIDDQPVSEIAQVTGLSESNVKVRLHRTRKKISLALNGIMQTRIST